MRELLLVGLVAACSFEGGANPGLGDDTIPIDAPPPIDAPAVAPPVDHPGGTRELEFELVTETLENFPVLVKIGPLDIDHLAVTEPHTYLAFQKDGLDLPYEDEAWNPSGTSWVWVKVPRLDANQLERMTILFGVPAQEHARYEPSEVWNNGFDGVWHMHNPLSVPDSAGDYNGAANDTKVVPGQIANAREFGDQGELQVIPFSSSGRLLDKWEQYALEAWLRPGDNGDEEDETRRFMSKGGTTGDISSGQGGLELEVSWLVGGNNGNGNGGSTTTRSDVATPQMQWTYVAMTCDGTTLRSYKDGVMTGMTSCDELRDDNTTLRLGDNDSDRAWRGIVDEFRVSAANRSPGWIAAQYRSMLGMFVKFVVE